MSHDPSSKAGFEFHTVVAAQDRFHPPKDELQFASSPRRINSVQQRKEGVVTFDFSGIERPPIPRKPAPLCPCGASSFLRLQMLDKPIQPRPVVCLHVHELHAHALAGFCVPDDGASAHFAAGHVENQFQVRSGGRGLATRRNTPPMLSVSTREISRFPPPCQATQKSLRRFVTGLAAPFSFLTFDDKSLRPE
jgi:hypothetical protein